MNILSMHASFGTLQNQTLTLHEGLNIITAPNESGKSTWASFLLAMLYGVDSSARATRGTLPVKTKYRPWSGAPMEGRLELEWNGRRIAIERTGKPRAPMSDFRAYDLDTMQPIAGMTGENCGELLLGVGRSVFERSAFLAQGGAAVTADAALEQKLASLVTTGDERVSFTDSRKRLNDWKNHCRHHKTGLLPEAEAELATVDARLSQLHTLHQDDLVLAAQEQELTRRRAQLLRIKQALDAQKAARDAQLLRDARLEAQQAQEAYDALARKTAALAPADTLAAQQQALTLLQLEAQQLPALPDEAPQPPACPPVFSGLAADAVLPKAQRDAEEYRRLTAGRYHPTVPFWIAAAVALLAAVALALLRRWIPAAVCAALCIAGVWCALRGRAANRAREARLDAADRLLDAYARHSADEFVSYAASYHEALLVYQHALSSFTQQREALSARRQSLSTRAAHLIGQVSAFAPQAADLQTALDAVQQAQAQYTLLQQAQNHAQTLRARCAAMETALGDAAQSVPADIDIDTDTTGYDAPRVELALSQLARSLASIRSQQDQSRGAAAALGDPARLQAQRESLHAKIQALTARYDALTLAMQTLDEANDELQTRFAPQLAALAGELLGKLTGARYDAVLLDRELRAEARQSGEPVTRQLLSLSGGTVDQVYLAVRLAICRLVLGDGAPMVLDDALVRFDDARLRAALALLRQESTSRQILLFTCQSREAAIAAEL